MSRRKRLTWLVTILLLVVAAILFSLPIDLHLKLPAGIIVSVFAILSGVVALTGDPDIYRKIFTRSPPPVSTEQLLKHLAQERLLARSESIGHEPIYQLDTDYWTNLELDFEKLLLKRDTLDLCASYVRQYLSRGSTWVLIIDPLEVKKKQLAIRQTFPEIVRRISGKGSFVWSEEIHTVSKATVLAGVFSPNIGDFLLEEAEHIVAAVFLVGPDSAYLSKKFKNLPFKAISIISTDTINELDSEIRRSILW